MSRYFHKPSLTEGDKVKIRAQFAAGLTQKQLADRWLVARVTIHKIIHGKKPL